MFCETEENKEMLKNYTKIIDEIKYQILSVTKDDLFVIGRSFMRLKFRTNDNLP